RTKATIVRPGTETSLVHRDCIADKRCASRSRLMTSLYARSERCGNKASSLRIYCGSETLPRISPKRRTVAAFRRLIGIDVELFGNYSDVHIERTGDRNRPRELTNWYCRPWPVVGSNPTPSASTLCPGRASRWRVSALGTCADPVSLFHRGRLEPRR